MSDMVDLCFSLDPKDPDKFFYGSVSKAKDGAILRLMVPAEGVLSPFTWVREHVLECCAGGESGVAFKAWTGPKGHLSDVLKATGFLDSVVTPPNLVKAVYRLWEMGSWGLTTGERER